MTGTGIVRIEATSWFSCEINLVVSSQKSFRVSAEESYGGKNHRGAKFSIARPNGRPPWRSWLRVHPELRRRWPNSLRRGAATAATFSGSGNGAPGSMVRAAERTLSAVFVKSEVQGAHAHRFRHTLATELLGQGWTSEDVADMLGNSGGDREEALRRVVEAGRLLSRPVQPHQTRVRRVFQRYGLVVPAHRGLPGSFQNDQILET